MFCVAAHVPRAARLAFASFAVACVSHCVLVRSTRDFLRLRLHSAFVTRMAATVSRLTRVLHFASTFLLAAHRACDRVHARFDFRLRCYFRLYRGICRLPYLRRAVLCVHLHRSVHAAGYTTAHHLRLFPLVCVARTHDAATFVCICVLRAVVHAMHLSSSWRRRGSYRASNHRQIVYPLRAVCTRGAFSCHCRRVVRLSRTFAQKIKSVLSIAGGRK